MKTSAEGLDLIKKYEGFRNHPYLCPANKWTIGYGFTYYPDGRKVKSTDAPISKAEADAMLEELVKVYEDAVERNVNRVLTQSQFDALVSFTFNLGEQNLKESTLLKKVNRSPSDPSIADEFKKWVYADGRKMTGLKKRRNQEAYLYFS